LSQVVVSVVLGSNPYSSANDSSGQTPITIKERCGTLDGLDPFSHLPVRLRIHLPRRSARFFSTS
jgi:hypothetical protein